jgi:hypothetical protein
MARITSTPSPVQHQPADMAALLKELADLRSALSSAQSRGARKPGFHVRPVPVPKKPGTPPARALADVVLPGGSITLSLYVGAHGKATFGGGFGSRGFGLWGEDVGPFCDWCESGALRAALSRPEIAAHLEPRWNGTGAAE